MERNCRGARLALLNARQSLPLQPPSALPRPPAVAMSASAVYVLDLKGKVLKAPHPPRCQATSGALVPRGPTLLLGNRPVSPTLAWRSGGLT